MRELHRPKASLPTRVFGYFLLVLIKYGPLLFATVLLAVTVPPLAVVPAGIVIWRKTRRQR